MGTKRAGRRRVSKPAKKKRAGSEKSKLNETTTFDDDVIEDDGAISGDLDDGTSYFESMDSKYRASSKRVESDDLDVREEHELGPPAKGMEALKDHYTQAFFPRWREFLKSNVSILVTGLGSKYQLLNEFARQLDGPADAPAVVVVNGFNPHASARLLIKELLALTPSSSRPSLPVLSSPIGSLVRALDRELDKKVVVVIHSIDGAGLRTSENQGALAKIASECSNVVLIASVDHVNAPLLWDDHLWHLFDWCLQNASTFDSYAAERRFSLNHGSHAFIKGSKTGTSDERKVRGAMMLLRSLSTNAHGIFRILAENESVGVTEQRLFDIGRSRFLTTSILGLRSILTEMQTHDLIQTTRTDEGNKISINLQPDQLATVLKSLD
uniref:Origin recognition complex subunit 2 n=1 Tax=Rhodosorus marinus TaxID=101924 RepID=A0A7S3A4B4_9RHOD|mmetsp:Transcript_44377/g.172505  ORF Transcript_44377/g.172505 Transcript_44377/m.172505 type:complete len:383 (+) Transcript_44377:298-1446(+)